MGLWRITSFRISKEKLLNTRPLILYTSSDCQSGSIWAPNPEFQTENIDKIDLTWKIAVEMRISVRGRWSVVFYIGFGVRSDLHPELEFHSWWVKSTWLGKYDGHSKRDVFRSPISRFPWYFVFSLRLTPPFLLRWKKWLNLGKRTE